MRTVHPGADERSIANPERPALLSSRPSHSKKKSCPKNIPALLSLFDTCGVQDEGHHHGEERTMHNPVKEFLNELKVGAKQSHNNMTLYCLLSAHEAAADFLTLDEALSGNLLMVTEVSEGGSVPELKVRNRSDRKVLLLDGEELVGAKQNRVLNVTILLAPESETVIPVSCVEQGRWSYRSRRFGSDSRAMSAYLRKKKAETVTRNLRRGQHFRSDQGVVWDEIEAKYARMSAQRSPTMAMADLYEEHKESAEDYLKVFHPVSNQVGIVVFIDGALAGIDILGKFDAFEKTFSKLVTSYVMDALETAHEKGKISQRSPRATASKVLEFAMGAHLETRKSVALGTDFRLESPELFGAGLEFDAQVLQLSIFQKNGSENHGYRTRPMTPASRRRGRVIH